MKQKIILQARHLTKIYQWRNQDTGIGEKIYALDDLSLDVYQGEILGILGPNGAGKTTLLNSLATLLTVDQGQIFIDGVEVIESQYDRIRSMINMSSGYPNYPWVMTVRENLVFFGKLYGLQGKVLHERVDEVMAIFELLPYANRRFDQLSSGLKQRLSLAKSLLNRPPILFLDEPTIGLDPDVALKMRAMILTVLRQSGTTVLLTTHNMDEVESMCDRVAFIKQGKIIKLATIPELKQLHHSQDLEQVFVYLAKSTRTTTPQALAPVNHQATLKPLKFNWRQFSNALWAFAQRNYIFATRNLFVMTDVFFWPMISLISIGLMTKFVGLEDNAVAFIMTGTLAAGVLQIVQLDVGYTMLYELWSKSLKHTLLTPIGILEGVLGTWLMGLVRGVIVFLFLLISAHVFFDFPVVNPLVAGTFFMGLSLCALLLGMLVNVLILYFGQKVEITAWMFAHLLMIICGIYYPVDILPYAMQVIAYLIPITYFLEYFRAPFGFPGGTSLVLWQGFALTGVYFFLITRLLAWSYKKARRRGIIIRLSE